MNKPWTVKASLLLATVLLLPAAQAQTMTQPDYKVSKARISAEYKSAKAACASLGGNTKDICVEGAKAARVTALADVRMGKEMGEVARDATADKMNAEYKVAIEKSDALTGDAKASCVTAAKAKFGKS
jgi:hypothetical protein